MVRAFCLVFCGPFIMVECILSVVYYKSILGGCDGISDGFTNILVYILIIMGCVSITVTGFCCYMSFMLGKTVKECWPQIRNPELQREDSIDSRSDDIERGGNI